MDVDGALRRLPGLPATVTAALAAVRNDSVGGDRLAETLQQDPGFSRAVLTVLDTPFFGAAGSEIGMRAICRSTSRVSLERAMIAAAVLRQLPGGGDQWFDRYAFWEHSVGVGVIARALAADLGQDEQQAFTAGLLHDLGRIVLDVYFPREFQGVVRYRQRHDTWIRDAEVAVLGFDHCVFGGSVAVRWGLPVDLVEAVCSHHTPEAANVHHDVTRMVHVADVLARGLQLGDPGDDTIPMLSQGAMKRLGLNWKALRRVLKDVDNQLPAGHDLVRLSIGHDACVSA
ncbi:HDIG domain-containing protein [Aquisalimonas asiatica]|uniref:HDIG domain-containing protein n=2 Tax=Aquisalimonas asiatica TaxID=406100 RepID=A0A1H8STH6_9GAMM|nr:HDIG domain-containing protein [Aquisalimonas asiatica]